MKVNKKVLQLIAAIQILIFHFWINSSNTGVENFIRTISYIGVDIFFFVSVYSMSQRYDENFNYLSFIKNRFKNIFIKYWILLAIAIVYKRYSSVIYKILGIEIFIKGGGAFLWFIPGIMLVYLLFPFFLKWKNKYKTYIVLAVYLLVSIAVTNFTSYKEIFILLNRLPVMLFGYELSKRKLKGNKLIGVVSIMLSLACLYKFGYKAKLNFPIYDFYYIFAIPFIYGLLPLVENIKLNKVFDKVSKTTLEIYGLQMIFGFDISSKIYLLFKNPLISNIVSLSLIILLAIIFKTVYDFINSKISFK
ncbi:MAG: acyltransferase family protein [Erysipelotrichaceae bacterium]|nr:acyltransferase family protein [Erysipelotrichaceae bacterium]